MRARVIIFRTNGRDADERLVRDYVVPEWDRLTSTDGCEGIRFSRYGIDPRIDGGEVHLAVFGDYEAVVESERDRWNELQEAGYINDWHITKLRWADWPSKQANLMKQLQMLASEMAIHYFETFDDRPSPDDAFLDDDDTLPTGWYVVIHFLMNQLGYEPEDEIDACYQAIAGRLRALAEIRGEEYAHEAIADLRRRFDDVESQFGG